LNGLNLRSEEYGYRTNLLFIIYIPKSGGEIWKFENLEIWEVVSPDKSDRNDNGGGGCFSRQVGIAMTTVAS
jgi:hypothetical protein